MCTSPVESRMENCDALDTDDLVRRACLLRMNGLFSLVSDNCVSILNFEPPSQPLFGPSVAPSSVALYIRQSPLDLGHMSSSSFFLYWSQVFPHPSKKSHYHIYRLHFTFHINNTNFFSRIGNPVGKVICYAPETKKSGFDAQQHAKDCIFSKKKSSSIMGRIQPSL
jgi:hypothetical protein